MLGCIILYPSIGGKVAVYYPFLLSMECTNTQQPFLPCLGALIHSIHPCMGALIHSILSSYAWVVLIHSNLSSYAWAHANTQQMLGCISAPMHGGGKDAWVLCIMLGCTNAQHNNTHHPFLLCLGALIHSIGGKDGVY